MLTPKYRLRRSQPLPYPDDARSGLYKIVTLNNRSIGRDGVAAYPYGK